MHQLTIDQRACRGLTLCHACEAIKPGLVDYCIRNGRLLISLANTAQQQPTISRLIAVCPDQAIVIEPVQAKVIT